MLEFTAKQVRMLRLGHASEAPMDVATIDSVDGGDSADTTVHNTVASSTLEVIASVGKLRSRAPSRLSHVAGVDSRRWWPLKLRRNSSY